MASYLEQSITGIAQAAGWQQPAADAAGGYSFSLQEHLDFYLFSPDGGNTIIFTSTVQSLPEDMQEQEDLLLAQAQRAVMAARTRASTLALRENNLILQQIISSKTTPLDDMPKIAEGFLNDLAWWRAQAVRLAR